MAGGARCVEGDLVGEDRRLSQFDQGADGRAGNQRQFGQAARQRTGAGGYRRPGRPVARSCPAGHCRHHRSGSAGRGWWRRTSGKRSPPVCRRARPGLLPGAGRTALAAVGAWMMIIFCNLITVNNYSLIFTYL